jgi:hypothetical protein
MSADRVCAQSGLLVDGDTRLLTDPCEYFHRGVDVPVGCARLRCASCNAWVRGGPPGLGFKDGVQRDVRALHAAPDWSALPFIEEQYALHNRMRLYVCTCRWWVAESVEPIDNNHEFESDPNVPWACAGHPVPELPLSLNNLTIDAGTNWPLLVDKILRGSCPRALDRKDALGDEPGVWLAWLYVYLQGLSIAGNHSSAIADRLDDSDPHVVGRVLYFFARFPRAVGIEKVVARAEADVHRVALGYPIPENRSAPTLWAVLVARLEHAPKQRDELDTRVESLIKRLLFTPLSSLPHDDLGPTGTVDFERQRRARLGWDNDTLNWFLDDFARSRKRERTDVIGNEIARSPGIFDDAEMRVFIADHIVELDAAAPGRWRQVMTLLTDWIHKPAQGHLIVVAGARLIQAGLVRPDEFRAWIRARRTAGWVDDAWVLPLESLLEQA